MTTQNFQIGQSYGNDLTIEVISRSEKFITFKTNAWGVKRAKLASDNQGEKLFFKSWLIYASDCFFEETSRQNSFERAYYS